MTNTIIIRSLALLLVLTLSLCLDYYVSNSYSSTTCTVDSRQCQTIQAAFNIVNSFDTVFLEPGIYSGSGNYNLCSKTGECDFTNVTLAGLGPAEDVVLAGQGEGGRLIHIAGDSVFRIKGLTIRDFFDDERTNVLSQSVGGVVLVENSTVALEGVRFENNSAFLGGAVRADYSAITVHNCSFFSNTAAWRGGALAVFNSALNVSSTAFLNNNASGIDTATASEGGAVYFADRDYHDLHLSDCLFERNMAGKSGGAVYLQANSLRGSPVADLYVGHSLFLRNFVSGTGECFSSCQSRGGAFFLSTGVVVFENTTFLRNYADTISGTDSALGGALYATDLHDSQNSATQVTLSKCVFRHNRAVGKGGAMYLTIQLLTMEHSLLEHNSVQTFSPYFTDAPSQGGAIWMSSLIRDSVIRNTLFRKNMALSGWAGAFYGSSSSGSLTFEQCVFSDNKVFASYTTAGQGGAVMVTSSFALILQNTIFSDNLAMPYLDLVPLTYSARGGAIFAQTVQLNVTDCLFTRNLALTGQFDSGSAGGAIVLEDTFPVSISHTVFRRNGAVGYLGTSSFAAPGTGGALYIKFSAAIVSNCTFQSNWVSAGGSQVSLGGAVAVYYSYASVSGQEEGVEILDSVFVNNTAFGLLCTDSSEVGQAGALSIIGVADPALVMRNVNFTNNVAMALTTSSSSTSLGGAITISQSSNVSLTQCFFHTNVAVNGEASDVASVAGDDGEENFVRFFNPSFVAYTYAEVREIVRHSVELQSLFCEAAQAIKEEAADIRNRNFLYGGPASTHTFSSNYAVVPHRLHSLDSTAGEGWGESKVVALSGPEVELAMVTEWLSDPQRASFDTDLGALKPEDKAKENLALRYQALLKEEIQFGAHEQDFGKVGLVGVDLASRSSAEAVSRRLLETLPEDVLEEEATTAETSSVSVTAGTDFRNTSVFETLVRFQPGVIITSGSCLFDSPTFVGAYHVFFGDYAAVSALKRGSDDNTGLNAGTKLSSSIIYGDIRQERLTLTVLRATLGLHFEESGRPTAAHQVNMFNGTLLVGNNLTFSSGCFLTDSVVSAVWNQTLEYGVSPFQFGKNHQLYFDGPVFVGIAAADLFGVNEAIISNFLRNDENITYGTSLTLVAVTMQVRRSLTLDSSSPNQMLEGRTLPLVVNKRATNLLMWLDQGAVLNITTTGHLFLLTHSLVVAEYKDEVAVINSGVISLLGETHSVVNAQGIDVRNSLETAELGSLTSAFSVLGHFWQTPQGVTNVTLNHTGQVAPVINVLTNRTLFGSIEVGFYQRGNANPDLTLYYPDSPSQWRLVSFSDPDADISESLLNLVAVELGYSSSVLTIVAPAGLTFSEKYASNQTDLQMSDFTDSRLSVQSLVLESIGCDYIDDYYAGVSTAGDGSSYPCYVCLLNSSCSVCGDGSCRVDGSCGSAGVEYSSSCCGDCEYGTCEGSEDNSNFECECSNIFFGGSSCSSFTTEFYLVVFSGVSILVVLLVGAIFYRRSLKQKKLVLAELREDILLNAEGSHNEYIQHMQQALILNDVFVKFDEIKLESVIGEGSFGVVHKATFRGAQVAVKMMRSVFVELTERDIEEFRKEAYVMSRLRHPNIVLVMGISLVEQEPMALPVPRGLSLLENSNTYDSTYSPEDQSFSQSKKSVKPQKTVCIITEYLEQGSLADILYGPTRLPEDVWSYELVLTCALQAARGMLYLHTHQPPICHRDLKSSNLVVDDHWVVKVTDFGMSRIVPEKMQSMENGSLKDPADTSARHQNETNRDSLSAENMGLDPLEEPPLTHTPQVISPPRAAEDPAEEGPVSAPFLGAEKGPWYKRAPPSLGVSTIKKDGKRRKGSSGSSGSLADLSLLDPFGSGGPPEMTSNMGTTAWCAPEVLSNTNRARYSVKVDVYSYGMVLWELWERRRPYEELTSRFDILDAVREGRRPSISDNCPPSFRSLIQRCWQSDPARRPMFRYIVRYLKDELARVKRQRTWGANEGPGPGQLQYPDATQSVSAPTFTPQQLSDVAPFDVQQNEDRRSSGSQGSFITRSITAARQSFGQIQRGTMGSNKDRDSEMGSVTGSEFTSSGKGNSPGKEGVAGSAGSRSAPVPVPVYPERKPLVEAVDRSLSYLSESPATAANSALAYQQQMYQPPPERHSRVPDSGSQTTSSDTQGESVQPSQQPPRATQQQGAWRDRYVMRFNGWKSTAPDARLPPSFSSPSRASNVSSQTNTGTGAPPSLLMFPPPGGQQPRQQSSSTISSTDNPLQQQQPVRDEATNRDSRDSGGSRHSTGSGVDV